MSKLAPSLVLFFFSKTPHKQFLISPAAPSLKYGTPKEFVEQQIPSESLLVAKTKQKTGQLMQGGMCAVVRITKLEIFCDGITKN